MIRPGIYIKDATPTGKPLNSSTSPICVFVGETLRGPVGVPKTVTSWSEFLDTFAYGLLTPFDADMDLAYSVYGFFQNGGKQAVILRVAGDAVKAKAKVPASTGPEFEAVDAGTWANGSVDGIEVVITATDSTFAIDIKCNDVVVESFRNVTDATLANTLLLNSKLVNIKTAGVLGADSGTTLSGGTSPTVADADFTAIFAPAEGSSPLDAITDILYICTPGETTTTVIEDLVAYCYGRGIIAVVDAPKASSASSIISLVDVTLKSDACGGMAIIPDSFIKIQDPNATKSTDIKVKDIPACGHWMGMSSRCISQYGSHYAPGGTDLPLIGVIGKTTEHTPAELDSLYLAKVNCIANKVGVGYIMYGVNTLSEDFPYVSDYVLDAEVKRMCYALTDFAIFQPNDSILWSRIESELKAYLDSKWKAGALKGANNTEAYYVKCDSELNNQNNSKVVALAGYAGKKPAEFIEIRIARNILG